MNRAALVIALALSSCGLAADRDLLAAKSQYVKEEDAAITEYLQQLGALHERLVTEQALDGVQAVKSHRARFLLGLEAPLPATPTVSEDVAREWQAGLAAYEMGKTARRMALEMVNEQEIAAALDDDRTAEAEALQRESASFRAGEYAPSEMETARKKPFVVAKPVHEDRMMRPLADSKYPDELDVGFQGRRFRISGACRHDTRTIDGKLRGHFGKAVLLPPDRSRTWKAHGYVVVADADSSTRSQNVNGLGLVVGSQLQTVIRLETLDPGAPYEWTVSTDRDEIVFEIARDGETLETTRIPRKARASVVFYATVRFVGNTTNMVVAID